MYGVDEIVIAHHARRLTPDELALTRPCVMALNGPPHEHDTASSPADVSDSDIFDT